MGLRFVVAVTLALIAARADAQPASSPQAPADRTCTTTTTVVKRGDVVLSTTSSTKCEDEPGTGGGLNPGAVLAGPGELLKSLAIGSGVKLTPRNVRGEWRVLEPGAIRVCHVFLTSQPAKAGLRVRTTECRGALARAADWRFEDDAAALYDADGRSVVKFRGDREGLQGQTEDGALLVLQR